MARSLWFALVTAILATWVGYAVKIYPRRRVLSWFELITDGYAPTFLANDAQAVLGALWADGFKRGLVDRRSGARKALVDYLSAFEQKDVLELAAGQAVAPSMWEEYLSGSGIGVRCVLTDIQPALEHWHKLQPHLQHVPEPVDATNASTIIRSHFPDWGDGAEVRMIHLALHHFPPSLVKSMFADAADVGAAILVGDLNPSAGGLLYNSWLAWKYMLLQIPSQIRVSPLKIFIVPLLPIAFVAAAHDATVSVLRAYSEEELKYMLASVPGGERYTTDSFESATFADWLGLPSILPAFDDPVVKFFWAVPPAS